MANPAVNQRFPLARKAVGYDEKEFWDGGDGELPAAACPVGDGKQSTVNSANPPYPQHPGTASS